jgi:hypothetical protein
MAFQCDISAVPTNPEFKDRTICEVFEDERAGLMSLRGPSTDLARTFTSSPNPMASITCGFPFATAVTASASKKPSPVPPIFDG